MPEEPWGHQLTSRCCETPPNICRSSCESHDGPIRVCLQPSGYRSPRSGRPGRGGGGACNASDAEGSIGTRRERGRAGARGGDSGRGHRAGRDHSELEHEQQRRGSPCCSGSSMRSAATPARSTASSAPTPRAGSGGSSRRRGSPSTASWAQSRRPSSRAASAGTPNCKGVPKPPAPPKPTAGPPCTEALFAAAAQANLLKNEKLVLSGPYQSAGMWTYNSPTVQVGSGPQTKVIDLMRWNGATWQVVDHALYCENGSVPALIYKQTCLSGSSAATNRTRVTQPVSSRPSGS